MITLTEADALADLAGTQRPDNASDEAKARAMLIADAVVDGHYLSVQELEHLRGSLARISVHIVKLGVPAFGYITDGIDKLVAAEREHWMRAGALMLVARSGQVTTLDLADRMMSLVAEQKRPNTAGKRRA